MKFDYICTLVNPYYMKRILLASLCLGFAVSVSAQTVNGLSYGSGYTDEEIVSAIGRPDSIEDKGNSVTYVYGKCRYTFDNGRFVDAKIADGTSAVGIPNGSFKVGDNLSSLIAIRADLKFVGFPEGLCRLEYVNDEGRVVQMFIKYDGDRNIVEISSFTVAGKKVRTGAGDSRFFDALPSVETPYLKLSSGDPLDKILSFTLDVEFSSYGNGICLISNKNHHEQYLIRYDLDLVIKEILPVVETTPEQKKSNVRLPKYNRF